MEIAKGIQAEQYHKLNLTDYYNDDWNLAFDIFNKRIVERFICPVEKLIEIEKDTHAIDKTYGFAIMAIDCLLTETIQSFYEGVTDSTHQSKKLFEHFLMERDSFKSYFLTLADADHFYYNVRCDIFHLAQTSVDTKIWAVGDLIQKRDQFVIINRVLYHNNLKDELNIYLNKLKSRNEIVLMDNFKNKMDFISGKI